MMAEDVLSEQKAKAKNEGCSQRSFVTLLPRDLSMKIRVMTGAVRGLQ